MHVRPKRKQQTKFVFFFDKQVIPYCKSYKYLGANIDEFLDYNFTMSAQADSAGRALSCIVTSPTMCTLPYMMLVLPLCLTMEVR